MNRRAFLAGIAALPFLDDDESLDDVLYRIAPQETPFLRGVDLGAGDRTVIAFGGFEHASDCAVHNAPAFPPGPCDCGGRIVWSEVQDPECWT